MSGTLSKAAFTSLRWNYLGFVVRSGSNFVIGILLARLLGPKPFGQLAAAALVIGIANLLADAGFTSALVQAPALAEIEIRYVFTMQLLIAALLTVLTMASAPFVAAAFHDPAIRNVILVISPVFLFQSLGQTASALLRREMDFKSIQAAQVSSYLAGYLLIGIPLAYLGAGVWSLVVAQLSQSLLYSVQLYWRVRHPVAFTLDRSGLRLLRYGMKVTMANIANWGISNLDNAVVGHSFGSTSLGLYSRGFTLASAPCDGVVGTVQQVLFTSCSRAEGRIEPIRKAYLASLAAVALTVFPAFWAMAACSTTVMVGLYGETWRPAAVLFRPLVIAVSINAVMALAGPILASLDHVKSEIHAQVASLVVAVACFTITSRYSPTVLSWGVCGVYVFRFVAATRPTMKLLQLSWRDVAGALYGPVFAALTTAGVLYEVNRYAVRAGVRPLFTILLLSLSGVVLLALLLTFLGRFLLASPLVDLLKTGLSGMPRPVMHWLERSTRRRKATAPAAEREAPAATIYIATTMRKVGGTGVHTHFNTLAEYLLQTGTAVETLTPYEAPVVLRKLVGAGMSLMRPLNVELAWRFKDFLYPQLLWLRMRAMLPKDKPWVVYAQCPVASATAARFKTQPDQTVVLVTHFNQSHAEENVEAGLARRGGGFYRSIQAAERKGLLQADRVIYVSEFMQRHLTDTFKELAGRPSTVLPNFIARPETTQGNYAGDLVSIGTLEPRKNQSFLLHVLAAAKRKGRCYTLTLFGTGKPEAEWRRLASELNIADQVTFAGYVPGASQYLSSFRVYVHAAKMESFGITFIEAMACGLPAIAACVGGIPEVIAEGETGFFWDLEDVEGAADILIRLLDDPALVATMGAAAMKRYIEHFSVDRIAPRLADFIVNGNPIEAKSTLDSIGDAGFEPLIPLLQAGEGPL